ncbi:sigma 54-interacting transcriptional regulator [Anaerovorax odorimutans]|uniref:Sigma 54-interacting transcriptional regulator n=1 Tax=Anaerovorax odorimutans TaxID=109327 RepID=A0ABT1RSJ7_9FIRM|nr:sigma 54-interacting transcriptional regulator [Anaerovorax odorimutans]MCQ4638142.1 sigma 54-interacting transcriptional regulator [Anaerovorax odorimutans]
MIHLNDEAKQLLNIIEGLVILDINSDIIFMTDELARSIGFSCGEEVTGRSIKDLLPHNTAYKVLSTGQKQIGEVYISEGHTVVSNAFPIHQGGKLAGVLEYDAFGDAAEIHKFLDKVINLNHEINYHKNDLRPLKSTKYSIDNIIGQSQATAHLKAQIKMVSYSVSTVLIYGETGSGKELVAHSIHDLSTRSLHNFIKVNCAAIPSELFESELFGYEEGSFTGAKRGGKKGLVELADGGTLFLDEIHQLSLAMQSKLLRFLQEREFMRVGGNTTITVDVRIIAATNENLQELVEQKLFREDLYYRLNIFEIQVPPLRERKEDIQPIAESIVGQLNNLLGRAEIRRVKTISGDALLLLKQYDWPGNIRELHNVLERAVNLCYEQVLDLKHFRDFQQKVIESQPASSVNRIGELFPQMSLITLKEAKMNAELAAVKTALSVFHGNKTRAAQSLGISRQALGKIVKKHNL